MRVRIGGREQAQARLERVPRSAAIGGVLPEDPERHVRLPEQRRIPSTAGLGGGVLQHALRFLPPLRSGQVEAEVSQRFAPQSGR
jgi:hypothetical protein